MSKADTIGLAVVTLLSVIGVAVVYLTNIAVTF